MKNKFPDNFIFGAASAAYQVEGAYKTDGKGLSNWDIFSKIEGKTFEATNGDIAVDHYNRFEEDIKLMAEQKLNSYRFSISWARILPNGYGKINQEGLNFYNNLIDCLVKNNIKPIITLYHWDLPQVLEDLGGWINPNISKYFEEYAKLCVSEFGDRVNEFITFNESSVFLTLGFLKGAHPPNKISMKDFLLAYNNVNISHAKAVIVAKQIKNNIRIGITHSVGPIYPGDCTKESFLKMKELKITDFNWYFDPILKGTMPKCNLYNELSKLVDLKETEDLLLEASFLNDFIGINYYQPRRVNKNSKSINEETLNLKREDAAGRTNDKREDLMYSKWGWEINPQGLYDILKQISEEYQGIEIIVTENGLGDQDKLSKGEILDFPRIYYINDHLYYVKKAIQNGVNVTGYYAWSFTDLLSWLNGFKKQYGFVYIDHNNNLKRKKKKSFEWYKEVIRSQGENIEKGNLCEQNIEFFLE